eukprot:1241886-Rhodomonas_salina.1
MPRGCRPCTFLPSPYTLDSRPSIPNPRQQSLGLWLVRVVKRGGGGRLCAGGRSWGWTRLRRRASSARARQVSALRRVEG